MTQKLLNHFEGKTPKKSIKKIKSKELKKGKVSSKKTFLPESAGMKKPEFPEFRELPPLDKKGVERFKKELKENPEELLKWMQKAIDSKMTMLQMKKLIYDAEIRINNKSFAAKEIRAEMKSMMMVNPLPPGFTFKGIDLKNIGIDPGLTNFQTYEDLLGWFMFSGPYKYFGPGKHPFFKHDNPSYSSGKNFIAEINSPQPGKDVDIALFADFGTGYYHSRYIAKQLREDKYPYVIHLGDVYYSGTQKEFDEQFINELDPMLDETCLFTLNSNHEMFSGSIPYFKYLIERMSKPNQLQRGSYFCLRNDKFQITAIDTDYYESSRYRDPSLRKWLEERLREGRAAGLINILMSANEPYEHDDEDLSKLIDKDLRQWVIDEKLVDLWFWGNVHYCALYDRSNELPFIGSCIGHGGYPYYTQNTDLDYKCPVKVRFLETKSRFWKFYDTRPDVGNNGYCVMKLKYDGSIELKYIDWMRNLRCTALLIRDANGILQLQGVKEFDK